MSGEHTPDFAGKAYIACLYGTATAQQQQSVASQLILTHASKGELCRALERFLAEADAGHVSVEADNLARAAIQKARS